MTYTQPARRDALGKDKPKRITKGLYLCFCDLTRATSGSAVRPLRMLQAFQECLIHLDVLEGTNRFRRLPDEKKKQVKSILSQLGTDHYDFCYIELPSGPIFHRIYRKLIKNLHKAGIPIGAYYRDARWMLPDAFMKDDSIKTKFKSKIIKCLHLRDIRAFNRYVDILYMPTLSFMNAVKEAATVSTETRLLPPGCSTLSNAETHAAYEKRLMTNSHLNLLYIGGATRDYGIGLLLDAIRIVNANEEVAQLVVVCPEQMWLQFIDEQVIDDINVRHICAYGDELHGIYAEADIGVIPFLASEYNRMAMPIKLCEYVSQAKPVLATNCDEMSVFVLETQIGWVVSDTAESLAKEISRLNQNRIEIVEKKANCYEVARQESWVNRCKTVLDDLGIQ